MKQVNLAEAKAQLSALVDAAAKGEEVVIARAGKPVAKLVPLATKPRPRFGALEGKIKFLIDEDKFDDPMPDFERDFYGK